MPIKLHGTSWSPATQLVAIILLEKDIPFELVDVSMEKKEHKTPQFLEKQPFGLMPYIDDDGFIMYEQRAIARYLADKYAHQGVPLIPPAGDFQARAHFEQAASIQFSEFHPYAVKIHFAVNVRRREGLEPDLEAFSVANAQLAGKLDAYERILSRQKYLGGDALSVADLFHIPFGHRIVLAGSDVFETRPNVARWWNEISSRPSWQRVKDGVTSNP